MNGFSWRDFLRSGVLGLAVAGTGSLVLRADAEPTPAGGDLGTYGDYLREGGDSIDAPTPAAWAPTEDNILGPFYRSSAPYRGKVTPALDPGTVMEIRGRVWAFDTRKPLAAATLDLWQANEQGRYDNDDPRHPPAPNVFKNRARVITDESGRYEFETIHPGAYRIGPNAWRPPHVHYIVRAPGYATLITQLYFCGDEHQARDRFIKESLIIDLEQTEHAATRYERGTFDIVLAPST